MPTAATAKHLSLESLLERLLAAGQISRHDHDQTLTAARMRGRHDLHPLALVGERRLTRACAPKDVLNVEALTEWLAGESGLLVANSGYAFLGQMPGNVLLVYGLGDE